MFENPRRGRQARNVTTNVPKILNLKSSSEQIFSENWRWVPLLLPALHFVLSHIFHLKWRLALVFCRLESRQEGGGGHWGVPNTAIPYEKLANTEIPCRKWTKHRYRIYDRWRLLNVVSISHVFLCQACIHQKSTSAFARKTWEDLELICTSIEKPGHWMSYHITE